MSSKDRYWLLTKLLLLEIIIIYYYSFITTRDRYSQGETKESGKRIFAGIWESISGT